MSERTRLGRLPERGSTDLVAARAILDAALIGHVGIVAEDGYPAVLPVGIARLPGADQAPDQVLMHGSTGSRLFRHLATGAPACLTVTQLDGLVLARSAFSSSMNYRSLMVFGPAHALTGAARENALRVLTDHLTPGRWDALRPLTAKEIAATAVMALPLVEFSVKSRSGGPSDGAEDGGLAIWAGVLPLVTSVGDPLPAPEVPSNLHCPPSWQEIAGTEGGRDAGQ